MKTLVPLQFISALLLSACASSPADEEDAFPLEVVPHAVHSYLCESGATISATYPSTDSATVQHKGSIHRMQIAVSGSGARYVDGELEWWIKGTGPGSEGALFRRMADGTSGERLELCTLQRDVVASWDVWRNKRVMKWKNRQDRYRKSD